eukprot:gene9080-12275_t
MARAPATIRPTLLMLVILPFWTSFLIRVYAWIGILKPEGLLTLLLQSLHILGPDQQVQIFHTQTAVYIGIVYSYLPFMILPLYSALEKLDGTLLEAANDLGCPPLKAFWKITFPLSLPGVIAGAMICFIPITGEFVIPDLLGGPDTLMIGKTLWTEFFGNRDWPLASAVAVILLLVLVVPIAIFQNQQQKIDPVILSLGFAFLYIPILILVVYSFNDSKLVTVWGGFSTRWYVQMWSNQGLMDAAWITIRVALLSASIGTVLGTLAALSLIRFTRFPGRLLFSGMIYAPLVMPDVITGL